MNSLVGELVRDYGFCKNAVFYLVSINEQLNDAWIPRNCYEQSLMAVCQIAGRYGNDSVDALQILDEEISRFFSSIRKRKKIYSFLDRLNVKESKMHEKGNDLTTRCLCNSVSDIFYDNDKLGADYLFGEVDIKKDDKFRETVTLVRRLLNL